MPTLALYTPPAVPDGWQQTLSPGGYESWHVTLADPATNTYLIASLQTGCQYHPGYLWQYERYLRNPTGEAPPLPPDWPVVHLAFFRDGRLYAESLTQYPRYAVAASVSSLDVHVALDRLWHEADGTVRLALHGRLAGGRRGEDMLRLDLTLYTISPPAWPQRVFNGAHGEAEHLWSPVASPCTAKGELTIRRGRGATAKTETLALSGRASVDHELGTRPLADDFTAWVGGAAFLPHAVVPIRMACAKARPTDALGAFYDADGRFCPIEPTSPQMGWSRAKRPYPTHVDASPLLRLDSPQVLEAHRGPVTYVLYRATTNGGEAGHALCHVLHPDRISGAMVKLFDEPIRPAN